VSYVTGDLNLKGRDTIRGVSFRTPYVCCMAMLPPNPLFHKVILTSEKLQENGQKVSKADYPNKKLFGSRNMWYLISQHPLGLSDHWEED
jgi:hypothetical protein